MKKFNLLKWGFLCLFCMLTTFVVAQTDATITWTLGDTYTDAASYAPESTIVPSDGIASTSISLGSYLKWRAVNQVNNIAFSEVACSDDDITDSNYRTDKSHKDDENVDFTITLEQGYTFVPKSVSFNASSNGSGNPLIAVYTVVDGTESANAIISDDHPQKSSESPYYTSYSFGEDSEDYSSALDNIEATQSFALRVYVYYKILTAKGVEFQNVVITGTLTNTTTGESYTVTFDPESGTQVETLSSFIVKCDYEDGIAFNSNPETYSVTKDDAAYEVSLSSDDYYEDENYQSFQLNLSSPLTEAGTYVFTFTEGAFNLGVDENSNTDTYTVTYIVTGASGGESNISEANWDWVNDNPAGIQNCATFEGTDGYIESDVDGLYMYVDATGYSDEANNKHSKVGPNGQNPQFTNGAKLHVPVVNAGDVVTFTGYSGLTYTIGDTEQTTDGSNTPYEYTATSEDANQGYVEIVSTNTSGYMRAVKVTYTTAVSSDEIGEDFIRPSVSLVSGAPEGETCGYLAYESEITFTAVNLPKDAKVYLKIADESNDIQYFTSELSPEDNIYTATLWEQVNLEDGVVYTVYVSVNSKDENDEDVEDTYTLFTVTGDGSYKSSVTLKSVTFDPSDEDGTLYTEETTVTLTFTDEVTITSASVRGTSNYTDISEESIKQSTEDTKVWTITLSADEMSGAQKIESLQLMVYAEDTEGLPVYDEDYGTEYLMLSYDNDIKDKEDDGGDTETITLTSNVDEDSEIIGSLSEIILTYNYEENEYGDYSVYLNPNSDNAGITVTDEESTTYTAGLETGDDYNQGKITFTPALTAGTYTITLTKGDDGAAFYAEIVDESNYGYNVIKDIDAADMTITFTISAIECEVLTSSISTEDNYITLSYNTPVKIDQDNTTIDVDGVSGSAIPVDSYSNTASADYAEVWTLTIDPTNFEQYAGEDLAVTVVAYDENGAEIEKSFTVSISSGDEDAMTFSPAEYTTFGVSDGNGLDAITVSCTDGIMRGESTNEITISGVDSEGATIDLSSVTITCDASDEDAAASCTITFSPAITTYGTYTITIPEDYFWVGDELDSNEATTLTYYVGETTGIKGITLKAGADDKFYNLNGQRVTSPRNGIYILNGKKVLIK